MTKQIKASELSAAHIGRRVRFRTTMGAVVEDELDAVLAATARPTHQGKVVLGLRMRHVAPSSWPARDESQEFGVPLDTEVEVEGEDAA